MTFKNPSVFAVLPDVLGENTLSNGLASSIGC